jgi:general secretion pathway protein C
MKHLFKPNIFKNILIFLSLLFIVKLVWFIIAWFWLPSSGVDHVGQKGGKALYYRVKLTPNEASAPTKPVEQRREKSGSINDIVLLAIYNSSDATVITVKHKGKTKVLSRGDEINGFVLEGAGIDFATFTKAKKSYKVMLHKGKGKHQNIGPSSAQNSTSSIGNRPKKVAGDVVDAGDHKLVDRSLVDHYAKNMDDIYKNIGISELKDGNNLKGFQITFVRKDSPFAKLGVQRGDIIKSINGQEINSYNAAFSVYKNIGSLDNLTLVIKRGEEEMELEYEIN